MKQFVHAYRTSLKASFLLCCVLLAPRTCGADSDGYGKAELVKKIDTAGFGALVLRYGDLDGDGTPDILAVQNKERDISCLTAFTLDGKRLWQIGEQQRDPNAKARTSSDLPVQIFDVNGDGKNEIITIFEGKLRILEGATGKTLKDSPVKGILDAVFIAPNIWPKEKGPAILIKTRYTKFWVYDRELKLQWKADENTGHFPFAFDRDGDGIDEMLVGYSLYDGSGKKLWHVEGPRDHDDSADAGDLNNDGKLEIALATGGAAFLLDTSGNVLWQRPMKHSQHAIIGSFIWSKPQEKAAVFLDRMNLGRISCFDVNGNELWQTPPQGWRAIMSAVDGWTGLKNQSLTLVYRRKFGPPVLINGKGKEVVRFPFVPAEDGKAFKTYYAQHFNLLGDGREEILVNNEKAIWIYGNGAPAPKQIEVSEGLPNRRIYNATFYVGMQ